MSDDFTITPEIQAIIDTHIATEVAGLKRKNGELIALNGTLKEQAARFDGIDPEVARSVLQRFNDDEERQLVAAGKIDDVLKKRTERMQTDHAKTLKTEQEARTRAEGKASKLAARTLAGAVRDAAIRSGALPEAMEDIVLRAGSTWRLNDDGDPVALNGEDVILSKDGKTPLTPQEWAESLRETAPHLWPRAQGTNAPGSAPGARSGKKTITRAQLEALPPAQRAGALKEASLVDSL